MGTRTTAVNRAFSETSRGLCYTMEVEHTALLPSLKVNQGVEDHRFDISATVEAGTTIVDLDSGRQWVAGARNHSATADAALALVPEAQDHGNAVGFHDGQPGAGNLAWIMIAGTAGLTGAGLGVARSRRSRT